MQICALLTSGPLVFLKVCLKVLKVPIFFLHLCNIKASRIAFTNRNQYSKQEELLFRPHKKSKIKDKGNFKCIF